MFLISCSTDTFSSLERGVVDLPRLACCELDRVRRRIKVEGVVETFLEAGLRAAGLEAADDMLRSVEVTPPP